MKLEDLPEMPDNNPNDPCDYFSDKCIALEQRLAYAKELLNDGYNRDIFDRDKFESFIEKLNAEGL